MSSHILAPFRAAARFVKAWTASAVDKMTEPTDLIRQAQESERVVDLARLRVYQQQPPLWTEMTPTEGISFEEWKKLLDSHYRR